jgi:hypothetical protein
MNALNHRRPNLTANEELLADAVLQAYTNARICETEAEEEEQGDTPVQGDTPPRTCSIYNVWAEDDDLDEWVYDPSDALVIKTAEQSRRKFPVYVTRYQEIDGNVLTTAFTRLSEKELEEDIALYVIPEDDDE